MEIGEPSDFPPTWPGCAAAEPTRIVTLDVLCRAKPWPLD